MAYPERLGLQDPPRQQFADRIRLLLRPATVQARYTLRDITGQLPAGEVRSIVEAAVGAYRRELSRRDRTAVLYSLADAAYRLGVWGGGGALMGGALGMAGAANPLAGALIGGVAGASMVLREPSPAQVERARIAANAAYYFSDIVKAARGEDSAEGRRERVETFMRNILLDPTPTAIPRYRFTSFKGPD